MAMSSVKEPPYKIETTKLCVVISGPTLNEARGQVKKACHSADIVEFRLDQFQFTQITAIKSLQESSTKPVIFTLRKRSHGGGYQGDEQERLEKVYQLAALQPDYFDLEFDVGEDVFEEVLEISPETKLISSYHDFSGQPFNPQPVFEVMQQNRASIYKIATMANNNIDSLKMVHFVSQNAKLGYSVIGICMGEHGQSSRLLGSIYGSAIVYATISEELKTAPGQFTAEDLISRYRIKKNSRETQVFGLIGDPVSRSPSHFTHNYVIKKLGLNAIYCKCNVTPRDLHDFLSLAKKLGISGLSVTMPLKEYVTKELTEPSDHASEIGAVNTLRIHQKSVEGFNTDGEGALDAIEERIPVQGKTVLIIGAGGAAKAIAWEAKKRKANIVILNRSIERAKELAEHVKGGYGPLSEFSHYASQGYDVLINCTSLGLYSEQNRLPIDPGAMLESKVVLDVIPGDRETPFLVEARRKNCNTISGNEMLMLQAVKQYLIWFGKQVEEASLKEAFQEAFDRFHS